MDLLDIQSVLSKSDHIEKNAIVPRVSIDMHTFEYVHGGSIINPVRTVLFEFYLQHTSIFWKVHSFWFMIDCWANLKAAWSTFGREGEHGRGPLICILAKKGSSHGVWKSLVLMSFAPKHQRFISESPVWHSLWARCHELLQGVAQFHRSARRDTKSSSLFRCYLKLLLLFGCWLVFWFWAMGVDYSMSHVIWIYNK